MLLEKPTRKEDVFFVTSANWSSVINAEDDKSAATAALEEVLQKYKKSAHVGPAITILNISKGIDEMDLDKHVSFVYTPEALADAGHHSKSSSLHEIINTLNSRIHKEND